MGASYNAETQVIPSQTTPEIAQLVANGEGARLGTVKPTKNKVRDKKLYDAAMVALLCGRHVEPAIRELARLMKSSDRDQVRLRAATTLIELACELTPSCGTPGPDRTVYVLVNAPDRIQGAADEARRRLLAAQVVQTK